MKTNDILKSLRQAKGFTQSDAAKELGVSLSSYQKYERDKNCITPSLEVLERMADFYHVTVDYLLGRVPEDEIALGLLSAEYSLTALESKIMKNYLSLPKPIRSELMKYLRGMIQAATEETNDSPNENGD